MRLVAAVAALALTPSAALAQDGPVAWADPCGDAAGSVTVAGQTTATPTRTGAATDLRGVEVASGGSTVVLTLDACGPVGSGEGTVTGLTARTADGCQVQLQRQDQVRVDLDGTASATPVGQLNLDCEQQPFVNPSDESVTLRGDAVRAEGARLVLTVDRAAMPPLLAEALAPGATLFDPSAFAGETAAVFSPVSVTVGGTTAFAGRTGGLDFAEGPDTLTLE